MPILDKTWAKDRTAAAPTGNASAHKGHVDGARVSFWDNRTMAVITPPVPMAMGQVRVSPSQNTLKAAPNIGAVELSVLDMVGPRRRIPATERLAETDGRINPAKAKRRTAGWLQWDQSKRNGDKDQ